MNVRKIKHIENNYFVYYSEEVAQFTFFCINQMQHEYNVDDLRNSIVLQTDNLKIKKSSAVHSVMTKANSDENMVTVFNIYKNDSYVHLKEDAQDIEHLGEIEVEEFLNRYDKKQTDNVK
ncbi:hypothetical protein ACQ1X9_11795 [Staphylococcus cohnii]|uniref:hypothetical protein n=1 Tax=Staphylococcus cohnii TaxID=29382 RepID=UPI003D7C5FF0